MTWQQFLTEKVLKECWHISERIEYPDSSDYFRCFKCKLPMRICSFRTFDNRDDMMDLYEVIEKDGKWEDFFWDFAFQRKPENYGFGEPETTTWLFCLSGEGYEDRCKMVAEFYGWEEKK